MSILKTLIEQYYASWQTGEFNSDLFAKDVSFKSPLMQCEGIDAFLTLFNKMREMIVVESLNEIGTVINDKSQEACVLYDFITRRPISDTTSCAENFTFEDGKIKTIALIYDPSEWEKAVKALEE